MSAIQIHIRSLCILGVIGFIPPVLAAAPDPATPPSPSQPTHPVKDTKHSRHATLREAGAQEADNASRSYGGKAEGRRHEDAPQGARGARPDKPPQ